MPRKLFAFLVRFLPVFIALVLIVVIVAVVALNSGGTAFTLDGIEASDPLALKDEVAGDSSMELREMTLSYLMGTRMLSFTQNGSTVTSYPEPKDSDNLTTLTKASLGNPAKIKCLLESGEVRSFDIDQSLYKVYFIKNGYAFVVDFAEHHIAFHIEVTIAKSSLSISVPFHSIKETGGVKLLSITPFPLFLAARQGDAGYAVIPDGSGALVEFDKIHTEYENDGFSKEIYGPDLSFSAGATAFSEQVLLPLYGMVNAGSTVTCIATGGEADMTINLSPPGVEGISFYRSNSTFLYRKSYQSELAKNKFTIQYQPLLIPGDKTLEIYVSGGGKSYVDMATTYADCLARQGVNPAGSSTADLYIDLFMAATKGEGIARSIVPLTTAENVKTIAGQLKSEALIVDYELSGYYKNGYEYGLPDKYPVSSKIGGAAGLKDAIAAIKQNGGKAYLLEDFHLSTKPDSIFTNQVCVTTPDNRPMNLLEPLPNGQLFNNTSRVFINPVLARDRMDKDLKHIRKLDPDGLVLKSIGRAAFTDYNKSKPLYKIQTVNGFVGQLAKLSGDGYKTGLGSANACYAGAVDIITDSPLQATPDRLIDRSIPLYQLCLSSYAGLTSTTLNLSDNFDYSAMKSLEYGVIPKLTLTYEPTSQLMDTEYSLLFSGCYADYKERIVALGASAKELNSRGLTGHRAVAEHVYVSTYSGGTKACFNYSDQPYSIDGVVVAPNSYQKIG